jgi:hypothetical protein
MFKAKGIKHGSIVSFKATAEVEVIDIEECSFLKDNPSPREAMPFHPLPRYFRRMGRIFAKEALIFNKGGDARPENSKRLTEAGFSTL